MNMKFLSAFLVSALLLSSSSEMMAGASAYTDGKRHEDLREVLRLHEKGMHNRVRRSMDRLYKELEKSEPKGYSVLCDVMMRIPGYESVMESYIYEFPESSVIPQIQYRHAMNVFDDGDYAKAGELLEDISASHIDRSQVDEYLFKKAYCEMDKGDLNKASLRFTELTKRPATDYTAPAQYSIAYIRYIGKDYPGAVEMFSKAAVDPRFKQISEYYMVICRFMLKDYRYVTVNGEKLYGNLPESQNIYLARLISESWLVLGNAQMARKYYDLNSKAGDELDSRSDWFYSGSVLFAVEDYKGAVESFSKMSHRTDSIGQIANYQMGYSYIQTKNKIAAMDAFKEAALSPYDAAMAEDAYFNWAKLAFDVNTDVSVFAAYMNRYPAKQKDERIYNYMAVAALHQRDYAAAVQAYEKIEEFDDNMQNNYVKANYLRASQLIGTGSYRDAIGYLEDAAYFSERHSRFNQMIRYWLAESKFRDESYDEALEIFTDLYNRSALNRQPESYMLSYNIAYCYYMQKDYQNANRWFEKYLREPVVEMKHDALERSADCYFISKDYKNAGAAYDKVLAEFADPDDIYPYYQSAMSYGLLGNRAKKIDLLSMVLDADPSVEYYPETIYELGRSYVAAGDDDNAYICFSRMADLVKDSTFVAKAYVEMGSLARTDSDFDKALDYYKKVVEEMPLSGCVDDALAAIESIYRSRNEPKAFLEYIESIGKSEVKTEEEKENMIFNAAEQLFLANSYQKSLSSLTEYLELYPDGEYVTKAHYYMASAYRNLGKPDQACDFYKKVIYSGSGAYVEYAMRDYAEVSYGLERWDDAYTGYSLLLSEAKGKVNKKLASMGMLRSAFEGHSWENALKSAESLLYDTEASAQEKREAEYVKAKSYMATSRRSEALVIFEKLSEDMSDEYGSESAYLLILDCYDKGDFEAVEERVFALADSGECLEYWLAKSYVVLGDSYADNNQLKNAQATFESIRDGYKPQDADDDIIDNVRMRLTKLEEMIGQN